MRPLLQRDSLLAEGALNLKKIGNAITAPTNRASPPKTFVANRLMQQLFVLFKWIHGHTRSLCSGETIMTAANLVGKFVSH